MKDVKIIEAGASVSMVLKNKSDVTAIIVNPQKIILSTSDVTPPVLTLDQFNQFHGAVLTLCIKETKNKRGQNHG